MARLRKLDDATPGEMAVLYADGHSLRRIGLVYGVTPSAVHKHLIRLGVELREPGNPNRRTVAPGPAARRRPNAGSPAYAVWSGIKQRCLNPGHTNFPYYGGRGVRICRRWRDSFESFEADVGPRPSPQHSLDRADNDGHYSCGRCPECRANDWPTNCRWATRAEQMANTRAAVRVTFRGETFCVEEWATRTGIRGRTIGGRLRRGLSPREALTSRKGLHGRGRVRDLAQQTRHIWKMMIRRCHNPDDKDYHRYGGRGITVYDPWRASFEAFVGDVGLRPDPSLTLDRIDNDGDYKPHNCRWATPAQQATNRRPSAY